MKPWLAALGLSIGCAACAVEDIAAVQPHGALGCDDARTPALQVGDVPCSAGHSQRFERALCSCESSVIAADLTTEIRVPGAAPFGAGVGWHGRLDVNATLTIAGTLTASSSDGIVGSELGALAVAGDLDVAGDCSGELDLAIGGDATIAGDLQAHDVSIAGTLRTPATATIAISGIDAAPRRGNDLAPIAAPCACDPASQHDIAALVAARRADNDNASIGLHATALENVQAPLALTLPCGNFHLSSLGGAADVELIVAGRAALYVDGDIALERSLTIRVEHGALDLFVAGNVTVVGTLQAGDAGSIVRTYVGGNGTLDLGGAAELGGFLYAPRAELVARDTLQAWGPVFVRRLNVDRPLTIRFDASGVDPAPDCDAP